jgi:hypothetical protein
MQIIPHIPFSGALSFRDVESDDRRPMIHVGFTPRWFAQHMDIDYGPAWHRDPLVRLASMRRMGEVLNERFPALRPGGRPETMRGSIHQVQTCGFMAALFGQDILYRRDAWPVNHGALLSAAEADALRVPDFRAHPLYLNLMEQMDLIEREWGPIEGELNYQGVLNTAFRLRGDAIFTDMVEAPERAHHVLDVVCDTMLAFSGDVAARQRASGVRREAFVTGNCVVNMISGDFYREFVMPRDIRLAQATRRFGIHNCAWRVDPYVAAYASVGEPSYLDFGMTTDLAALPGAFPQATLAAMIHPVALMRTTPEELGAELARLHAAIPRGHVIVADIEAGTPDESVVDVYRLAAKLWDVDLESLLPGCGQESVQENAVRTESARRDASPYPGLLDIHG